MGNLPGDVSQDELWELFAPFGNLIEAFLFKRGPETAKGAFVRFTADGPVEFSVKACTTVLCIFVAFTPDVWSQVDFSVISMAE